MPGTLIFKPIEAKLVRDTEVVGKMNPYCLIRLGSENYSSQVCKNGGANPHWTDEITVPVSENQGPCTVSVRDNNILVEEDVGSFEFDPNQVQKQGKTRDWFPLYHKNQHVGNLLLETWFIPEHVSRIQDPKKHEEQKVVPGTFLNAYQPKRVKEQEGGISSQGSVEHSSDKCIFHREDLQ